MPSATTARRGPWATRCGSTKATSRPSRPPSDLHRVHNAHADRVSISIHVYGANIGAVRRHTYPAEGGRKPFVSGYTNTLLPNLWDRSAELRAVPPATTP